MISRFLIGGAMLAFWSMSPAAAQSAAPERDIVVTGRSLKTTQAALDACLARKCPPKEDIDATLAHAENAFVAGNYQDARRTLRASIGRNRRHARTLPVDLSDLLRANSRVAGHLGQKEAFLIGALDVVSALKAGLPDSDPRILEARIEVADGIARSGDVLRAITGYRAVVADAHKLGLTRVEGNARLRTAILLGAMGETDPGVRRDAQREIDALVANPAFASYAEAARMIRTKPALKTSAEVDALVASYKVAPGAVPVLLYAPPMLDNPQLGLDRLSGSTLNQMQMRDVDDQWVDIGFWIAADGRVSDVDLLRESPSRSGNWVEPITKAIAGRRYAAFTPKPGQTGMMRVERYTLTAYWRKQTGTNIRMRSPVSRIEMLDLTS